MSRRGESDAMALDEINRLTTLLTAKGLIIQELPDGDNKYRFVLKHISKPEVILGTFICEIGDISYLESSHAMPGSATRSRRVFAENNDEQVDAIHLRWINITEGNQGKGYSVLLFMYGILFMMLKYTKIVYFYLEDCSNNIGDFLNNLYYKCGVMMDDSTGLISPDLDNPELNEYLQQRKLEIEQEEVAKRLNPDSLYMTIFPNDSKDEDEYEDQDEDHD